MYKQNKIEIQNVESPMIFINHPIEGKDKQRIEKNEIGLCQICTKLIRRENRGVGPKISLFHILNRPEIDSRIKNRFIHLEKNENS